MNTGAATVVPLERDDREVAVRVAMRAYLHDPMAIYMVPDEERRAAALTRILQLALVYCAEYGDLVTTPETAGVSMWLTPGNTRMSLPRMLLSGLLFLPLRIGLRAFGRFQEIAEYGDTVHEALLRGPHWQLLFLAVEPERQGRGIGGALLRPVIEIADHDRLPIYVESTHDRNLPFLRRHGFEVVHEGKVSEAGPLLWALVRSPQSDRG